MLVGKRLKEARENCNLSSSELGKLVGVSKSAISLYEKEKRNPKIDTLIEIMYTLGVSADYLLGTDVIVEYVDESVQKYQSFSKEEVEFINELRKDKDLQEALLTDPHKSIKRIKKKI